MPQNGQLIAASFVDGLVVRIDGRGTLNESVTLRDTVREALVRDECAIALLDLNACTYLDSTMLGCLIALHREFSLTADPPRFQIVAGHEARQRLLAPMRLDSHLALREDFPPAAGQWMTLKPEQPALAEFGRHVMDCHNRLADAGVPKADAFRLVAQQLASDLAGR